MVARRQLPTAAPKQDETRMVRCTIRLSQSTVQAARQLAETDHVSLNQWMSAALAEKISAAAAPAGSQRTTIQIVGDLLAPINADWNVGEDL